MFFSSRNWKMSQGWGKDDIDQGTGRRIQSSVGICAGVFFVFKSSHWLAQLHRDGGTQSCLDGDLQLPFHSRSLRAPPKLTLPHPPVKVCLQFRLNVFCALKFLGWANQFLLHKNFAVRAPPCRNCQCTTSVPHLKGMLDMTEVGCVYSQSGADFPLLNTPACTGLRNFKNAWSKPHPCKSTLPAMPNACRTLK